MDKFKPYSSFFSGSGKKSIGTDQLYSLNFLEQHSPSLHFISEPQPDYAFLYHAASRKIFSKFNLPRQPAFTDIVKRCHPKDRKSALASFTACIEQGQSSACYRLRDINNDYHWLLDNKSLARDTDGDKVVGLINPVALTDRAFLATLRNAITMNADRQDTETRFAELIGSSRSDRNIVCVLDIDKFTVINTSYGYSAGDVLLEEVMTFIESRLRDHAFFARYQADKFLVVFTDTTKKKAVDRLKGLQAQFGEFRFHWDDKQHIITLSIGLVPTSESDKTPQELISKAILACSFAKEKGRNGMHIYESRNAVVDERKEEMLWVEKINTAIEEDRFILFSQPIEPFRGDLRSGHFELLIRMKDEQNNIIAPGTFLPAVERFNLSGKIDRWVIQTALSWLQAYEELLKLDHSWGINLSGTSLADNDMLDFVFEQIRSKQIPPEKIYFEITETAAIANIDEAVRFVNELKNMGCKFALDDFGSGLSSFSYLKHLPVDYLKIDGQFIRNLKHNNTDYVIVASINEIARSLNIKTIAEFVEDAETISLLRELGIDYGQGYHIARPFPLSEFKNKYGSILN